MHLVSFFPKVGERWGGELLILPTVLWELSPGTRLGKMQMKGVGNARAPRPWRTQVVLGPGW